MYWTVGAKLGDEVVDYMRWVRGSGNLMPHLAGPIAKHGQGAAAILCRASSGILEPCPGQQQYYAAPRRVGVDLPPL